VDVELWRAPLSWFACGWTGDHPGIRWRSAR
jgi:hypothetical protein